MTDFEKERDKYLRKMCLSSGMEKGQPDAFRLGSDWADARSEKRIQELEADSERWQRMLNQMQELAIERAKEIQSLEAGSIFNKLKTKYNDQETKGGE